MKAKLREEALKLEIDSSIDPSAQYLTHLEWRKMLKQELAKTDIDENGNVKEQANRLSQKDIANQSGVHLDMVHRLLGDKCKQETYKQDKVNAVIGTFGLEMEWVMKVKRVPGAVADSAVGQGATAQLEDAIKEYKTRKAEPCS
ncbi:MAG: hypothetical protein ACPGXZ_00715 [Saprospiraceae bacterium]